jgi:hypothetical protein
MSVVIEADGAVRPCFFHEPVGSLRETSLRRLVQQNLPRSGRPWLLARTPCVSAVSAR